MSDLLRGLRRRWWLLALAVAGGVVGAYLANLSSVPQYAASVSMYLAQADGLPAQDLSAQAAAERVSTYAQLAQGDQMLSRAIESAGGEEPLRNVSVSLEATGSPIFMNFTATADSSAGASRLAEAYVREFPQFVAEFQGLSPSENSPVGVFGDISTSSSPLSASRAEQMLTGIALGLVIGVAGIFFLEANDRRLRTSDQAADATGLPLLAAIPYDRGRWAVDAPNPARAEAIRQLRTDLRFARTGVPLQSLAITSATGSEGKTATAVELARMVARDGRRVLLVDADLRRSSIAGLLGLSAAPGLTDVLTDDLSLDEVLQSWGEGTPVAVLTSGSATSEPSELLGSDRMHHLAKELVQRFDLVIFDTPPLLAVTDTSVLAQGLDTVVLVCRVGDSRRDHLRQAAVLVGELDINMLGIVSWGEGPTVTQEYLRGIWRSRAGAPVADRGSSSRRSSATTTAPEPLRARHSPEE